MSSPTPSCTRRWRPLRLTADELVPIFVVMASVFCWSFHLFVIQSSGKDFYVRWLLDIYKAFVVKKITTCSTNSCLSDSLSDLQCNLLVRRPTKGLNPSLAYFSVQFILPCHPCPPSNMWSTFVCQAIHFCIIFCHTEDIFIYCSLAKEKRVKYCYNFYEDLQNEFSCPILINIR